VQALVIDEYHVSSAAYYALRVFALEFLRRIPVFFMTATSEEGFGLDGDREFTIGHNVTEEIPLAAWPTALGDSHPWLPRRIRGRTMIFCADLAELNLLHDWYRDNGVNVLTLHSRNYHIMFEKVRTKLKSSVGRAVVILVDDIMETGVTVPVDVVIDSGYKAVPSLSLSQRELLWKKRRVTKFESYQRAGRVGRLVDGSYYVAVHDFSPVEELETHQEFHAYLWLIVLGFEPIKSIFDRVAQVLQPVTRYGAALMLNCYLHPAITRCYMDDESSYYANAVGVMSLYSFQSSSGISSSAFFSMDADRGDDWFDISVPDRLSSSSAIIQLRVPFRPTSYCVGALEHIAYEMRHWDEGNARADFHDLVRSEKPKKLVVKGVHRIPSREIRLATRRSAVSVSAHSDAEKSVKPQLRRKSVAKTDVADLPRTMGRVRAATDADRRDERRDLPGGWPQVSQEEIIPRQVKPVGAARLRARTSFGSIDSEYVPRAVTERDRKPRSTSYRMNIGGGRVRHEPSFPTRMARAVTVESSAERVTTSAINVSRPLDARTMMPTDLVQPTERFRRPNVIYTECTKHDSQFMRRMLRQAEVLSLSDVEARLAAHDSFVKYWNHLVVKRSALDASLVVKRNTLMMATSGMAVRYHQFAYESAKAHLRRVNGRMDALRLLHNVFRSYYFSLEKLVITMPDIVRDMCGSAQWRGLRVSSFDAVRVLDTLVFSHSDYVWHGVVFRGGCLTVRHAFERFGLRDGEIIRVTFSRERVYNATLRYHRTCDACFVEISGCPISDALSYVGVVPAVLSAQRVKVVNKAFDAGRERGRLKLTAGVLSAPSLVCPFRGALGEALWTARYHAASGYSGSPVYHSTTNTLVGIHVGRLSSSGKSLFLPLLV
jgi:hypothetical protein